MAEEVRDTTSISDGRRTLILPRLSMAELIALLRLATADQPDLTLRAWARGFIDAAALEGATVVERSERGE